MLGSEVVRVAKKSRCEVIEVSRTEGLTFDAETTSFDDLAKSLGLCATDYLINCIGWIPQKSTGDATEDRRLAQLLNVILPDQINQSAEVLGFSWIQIGTDCVFDGREGSYTEASPKNAQDLYGASKISGELLSNRAMIIRASIIGADRRTNAGLYAWFLGQLSAGKVVTGYRNHLWNGVSTTAFARLAVGVAKKGRIGSIDAHWLPRDVVSKYTLLGLFAKKHGYSRESVIPGLGAVAIDRTLATDDVLRNAEFWQIAGYQDVPSVEELVAELVQEDLNQRS
jgi:dTDP-4-dehydrorhamnose reductase